MTRVGIELPKIHYNTAQMGSLPFCAFQTRQPRLRGLGLPVVCRLAKPQLIGPLGHPRFPAPPVTLSPITSKGLSRYRNQRAVVAIRYLARRYVRSARPAAGTAVTTTTKQSPDHAPISIYSY